MRLIGTLSNEYQARRIAAHLRNKGIESHCDMVFDTKTGAMSYPLWVLEEDRIAEAADDFDQFQKDPSHAEFDAPAVLQMAEEERVEPTPDALTESRRRSPFTLFLIGLCAAIFLLNALEEFSMSKEGLGSLNLFTPVQSLFLYDLPPSFEVLEQWIQSHSIVPGQTAENLAPEVRKSLQQIESTPYWRGAYDWILLKAEGKDSSLMGGPLFLRIRQGEVWRLFSPCVLHTEFLHILFNMIWLWVLGRPIEQRIGAARTALLTIVAGVGSNTIQYLVGGPFFIGYSGIVMALAGFIWMRQKTAPWEGYPLNRTTMLFLLLFVGSMFLLTMVSFILQLAAHISFAPNIANTAHIAGGLIGCLLGKFSFFSWRAKK